MNVPKEILYLKRILEAIEQAINFSSDLTQEEYLSDLKTKFAIGMILVIIGEQAIILIKKLLSLWNKINILNGKKLLHLEII
jgi:uncharacterized protein with HEPN domain